MSNRIRDSPDDALLFFCVMILVVLLCKFILLSFAAIGCLGDSTRLNILRKVRGRMIFVPKAQMHDFKKYGELEDSKRRKSIHFFGADIAVSAF